MCGTLTSTAPIPTEEEAATPDRMADVRLSHPRAYERWSEEEDEQLKKMLDDGLTPEKIAEALQRQPSAIFSRIRKQSE